MALQEIVETVTESISVKKEIVELLNLINSSSNNENVIKSSDKLINKVKHLNLIDFKILELIKEEQGEKHNTTYDIIYYSNKKLKRSVLLRKISNGYAVIYNDIKDKKQNKNYAYDNQVEAIKKYYHVLTNLVDKK